MLGFFHRILESFSHESNRITMNTFSHLEDLMSSLCAVCCLVEGDTGQEAADGEKQEENKY